MDISVCFGHLYCSVPDIYIAVVTCNSSLCKWVWAQCVIRLYTFVKRLQTYLQHLQDIFIWLISRIFFYCKAKIFLPKCIIEPSSVFHLYTLNHICRRSHREKWGPVFHKLRYRSPVVSSPAAYFISQIVRSQFIPLASPYFFHAQSISFPYLFLYIMCIPQSMPRKRVHTWRTGIWLGFCIRYK